MMLMCMNAMGEEEAEPVVAFRSTQNILTDVGEEQIFYPLHPVILPGNFHFDFLSDF